MTDEEREQQRISFAFGNAKLHNPDITREMVAEQSRLLAEKVKDDVDEAVAETKIRSEKLNLEDEARVKKEKCPEVKCFFWVLPGGRADVSGKVHANVDESIRNGKWVDFPNGGCSHHLKCSRLFPESNNDFFEPEI